ncbi:MAG: tetratricopeptide repeat protein, partial [Planctomycetota bacterium]|nr:tetratricopeptide repeat protein [Planctomycetota bacterium]
MRSSLIVLCAAGALALTANFASAQPKSKPAPRGAYLMLNDAAVVKDMRDLGMKELLAGLAGEDYDGKDLPKLMAAASATLGEASFVLEPEAHDKVLDRAVAIMDKAEPMAKEAAEAPDASIRVRMEYVRLRLMKATTQGVTRCEPYVQQILYLLEGESDRKAILKWAPEAHKAVVLLAKEISNAQSALTGDDKILGGQRVLDALAAETRYNEARMLLYEGIATPTDAAGLKTRATLLPQAITMVAEWLVPAAAAGGKRRAVSVSVQQESLMLAGIASREMRESEKAKIYLEQLLAEGVPLAKQAQAMFEIAHTVVDQGKLEPGLAAVKDFRDKALKGRMLKEVGIDMQATLLTSHLYDNLSAAAAGDAKKAREYTSKSAQVLLDFIKKYPDYTRAFLKIIKRKFQGQDLANLPVGLRIMLTGDETEANKIITVLEEIVNSPEIKTPAEMVEALMGLGEQYRKAGRLGLAAARYRRVAEEYPKESAAPDAALRAVNCLHAGVNDTGTFGPGSAESKEYTHCLKVLLANWGEKENRDYLYFLGMQYERTNQFAEAIAAFDKVSPEAGVYAPAKFHSLTIRGSMLMATSPANAARKPQAAALIEATKAFHSFIVNYKTADEAKIADVRTFGPEVDLLASQVQLEILGNYEGARAAALRLPQDWPEISQQVRGRCKVVVILSYLKESNVKGAMEVVKDASSLSEDILSEIVRQLRGLVERLDPVTQKAEREDMGKQYAMFVEDIYRRALERFKAHAASQPGSYPAEWLDTQMYEYTKGLAGAMEESNDKNVILKALKHYQRLLELRKDDAVVIRGLARCYRKLPEPILAMSFYNRLVNGLADRSLPWWQAHLERMEYGLEIFAREPEQIDKILMVLRTLGENDP